MDTSKITENLPDKTTTQLPTSRSSYNPFEHRVVHRPSSDIRSLANLLKASLGSGILAMPLAFSQSGWVVGIIGTALIAFLCAHCVAIFVKTSRGVCKLGREPQLSYAETCRAAFLYGPERFRRFAKSAYVFAQFSLICTCYGVCCIYLVLIADNTKQIFDRYVFKDQDTAVEFYVMAYLIPLCLIVQIKHLKLLAPFSFIANVLLVLTFAICLYYIFGEDIILSDKSLFGHLERYPAYLSTVIFAMEGIGVVMPVENTMKNPEHFLGWRGILAIAMTFIAIIYTVLGLFGYLRYGNDCRGSITLNLPIDDWPAIAAKCFICISIFLTYPLHFFVVLDIVSRLIESHINKKYETLIQVFIRIGCVLLCGVIGVVLPMLEQIINIVGAVFYSILGLIIPGIIETVFKWEALGKFRWILWKNSLIVLFGLLCLVSGCTVTIKDIIEKYDTKFFEQIF